MYLTCTVCTITLGALSSYHRPLSTPVRKELGTSSGALQRYAGLAGLAGHAVAGQQLPPRSLTRLPNPHLSFHAFGLSLARLDPGLSFPSRTRTKTNYPIMASIARSLRPAAFKLATRSFMPAPSHRAIQAPARLVSVFPGCDLNFPTTSESLPR